jgi:hypothetical protein
MLWSRCQCVSTTVELKRAYLVPMKLFPLKAFKASSASCHANGQLWFRVWRGTTQQLTRVFSNSTNPKPRDMNVSVTQAVLPRPSLTSHDTNIDDAARAIEKLGDVVRASVHGQTWALVMSGSNPQVQRSTYDQDITCEPWLMLVVDGGVREA